MNWGYGKSTRRSWHPMLTSFCSLVYHHCNLYRTCSSPANPFGGILYNFPRFSNQENQFTCTLVFDHSDVDRYRPNLLSQLTNSPFTDLLYKNSNCFWPWLSQKRAKLVTTSFGSFGRCSAELNLQSWFVSDDATMTSKKHPWNSSRGWFSAIHEL